MSKTQGPLFETHTPRYFNIASSRPFLRDLAAELHSAINSVKNLELADAVIYLPTRRAVRALSEAFVATAPKARASLLPQIKALGDIDEDEFIMFAGAGEDEIDLPPAIGALERRLTLAGLVAAKERAFDGQEHWTGALAAADELGKLLDSFYTEEVSPDALEKIVPDHLAAHWRASLDFLSIITTMWPAYLKERGLLDPAERRVKLIDLQTRRWCEAPPQTPIIIAGTTGSTPAVARMMKTVATLPRGCVVLPGLDLNCDAQSWEAVDQPHPQSGLKQLLSELSADRSVIREWPMADSGVDKNSRSDLISVALTPANATDSWREWSLRVRKDRSALETSLHNIEFVEASDEEIEANAIAIRLRGAIEELHQSAMLVTPDRDLARRVSMKMRRWGITVDDSAGVPFANTPCGAYLRLIAAWLNDVSNPALLLAIVRHPLFGGGLDKRDRRRAATALDLALRGLKPRPGMEELQRKVSESERLAPNAQPLIELVKGALCNWPGGSAAFADRFSAHLKIAEALAATDELSGLERLWRGDDGEAGALLLAELQQACTHINHDAPDDYADIFNQLIAKGVVRRRAPAHPRIAILGPLEARLQRADVVILGGLNEGAWPRDAAIDPFLSRPMRKALGLPSPEQRIGLAAHDFAQLAAAPAVMLTRAVRAGGKPTKPSRWIVRLKNILAGAGALQVIDKTQYFETLVMRLDEPGELQNLETPQPRPPVKARPTEFYVTRIEKLLRDPYAIYARTILRLKTLDPFNERFDARHAGNLFHKLFQDYVEQDVPVTHDARVAALHTLFDQYANKFGLTSDHRAFWSTPINEAIEWFAQWDAERRSEGAPLVTEATGEWAFSVEGRDYRLSARADRIDQLTSGGVVIFDYKTGAPPSLNQTKAFSPQLPLTGVIAMEGGFDALGSASIEGFEYVRVLRRKDPKKDNIGAYDADARQAIDDARKGLFALMKHFNNPDAPYPSQPRSEYIDDYGDYDHLARRRERNAQGGAE